MSNMGGDTTAVHIEGEVLELDRLNSRTKGRIRKAEQAKKRTIQRANKRNRRLQKLVVRVASTVAASAGAATPDSRPSISVSISRRDRTRVQLRFIIDLLFCVNA